MVFTGRYNSPLGGITFAGEDGALSGLWFDGQKYFAETLKGRYAEGELPVFSMVRRWLDVYFSGSAPDFTPPLATEGASPFRKMVWQILLSIPFGNTLTYGQIAARIQSETSKRVSAQAVGGAVGHNPISVIIPCHRVVGADGSLTCYAGGIDKKLALLKLEGADVSKSTFK